MMSEQRKNDQVVAVTSLIKRLLVYWIERKEVRESSIKEEAKWEREASNAKNKEEEEFLGEEIEAAIHISKCIHDLDWQDELHENPKLVEFLCTEPDKPAPEIQDPLKTINLGTGEDPRPIQLSGLLETKDQAIIVDILHEFKDCLLGITQRCQDYIPS